ATLKADLGVGIATGGERTYVGDDRGERLDGGKLLAAITELTLRRCAGGTIAAPVTAPSVVETVAERYGGTVVYTKVMPHALTSAATSAGMVLVGDGAGGFVFPEFHPVFDGMFTTMKLLEALARFNTKLSDVVNSLP